MEGACKAIGYGMDVDIWNDPWIPTLESFKSTGVGNSNPDFKRVGDLFHANSRGWNFELLTALFDQQTIHAITKIQPHLTRNPNPFV